MIEPTSCCGISLMRKREAGLCCAIHDVQHHMRQEIYTLAVGQPQCRGTQQASKHAYIKVQQREGSGGVLRLLGFQKRLPVHTYFVVSTSFSTQSMHQATFTILLPVVGRVFGSDTIGIESCRQNYRR